MPSTKDGVLVKYCLWGKKPQQLQLKIRKKLTLLQNTDCYALLWAAIFLQEVILYSVYGRTYIYIFLYVYI